MNTATNNRCHSIQHVGTQQPNGSSAQRVRERESMRVTNMYCLGLYNLIKHPGNTLPPPTSFEPHFSPQVWKRGACPIRHFLSPTYLKHYVRYPFVVHAYSISCTRTQLTIDIVDVPIILHPFETPCFCIVQFSKLTLFVGDDNDDNYSRRCGCWWWWLGDDNNDNGRMAGWPSQRWFIANIFQLSMNASQANLYL